MDIYIQRTGFPNGIACKRAEMQQTLYVYSEFAVAAFE